MATSREWYWLNKERATKSGRNTRLKIKELRNKVLAALGSKCVKCGFEDVRALQIDHVHSGGCLEQKQYGTGVKYLNLVALSVFKNDGKYQLLCANCNIIKKYDKNEFRGQIKKLIDKPKEKTLFDV